MKTIKENLGVILVCMLLAAVIAGCNDNKAEQTGEGTAVVVPAKTGEKKQPLVPADFKEKAIVVVPSPDEVFNALEGLSEGVRWDDYCEVPDKEDYGDIQEKMALNMGNRVATSFVCIMAKDKESTLELGRVIKNLGKGLQVEDQIQKPSFQIVNSVNEEDWPAVRRAMDAVQADVERELKEELGHDEYVKLMSIGGWVTGLYYVSSIIDENYSEDSSTVLSQSSLADYFIRQMELLPPETSSIKCVSEIQAKLKEVASLLQASGDKTISHEKVKELREIAAGLKAAIEN